MTQPTDPTGTPQPQWSAPVEGSTDSVPTPPLSGTVPAPAGTAPAPAVAPVAQAPAAFAPIATAPAVPTAPVTPARGSRRRGVIDVVLVVAAIFAVGGVGFAAGRITAPASTVAAGGNRFQGGNGGQFGNGGAPGGGFGGAFGGGGAGITIRGQVVSLTADQLTLKLASGQTVQIPLSSSTTYHSATAASASDVTTGSTVQVQVSRGGGNDGNGGNGGTGNGGTGNGGSGATGGGRFSLGAASDVTVVPQ